MSRPRSRLADFKHLFPMSVRWADMDALGHVNNAKYLTYTESARIAFFDEVFRDDPDFMNGQGPILADAQCSYHEQLHYPSRIEVGIGVSSIGNTSLKMRCPIFLRERQEAVADVRIVLVWFDYRNQRPMAVPDRMRDIARELMVGELQ